MRWLIVFLCCCTTLAWAKPTELTPEQRRAVDSVLDFYKSMGEKDRLQALKDGLEAGNIQFGPTQANANAECDMSRDDRPININPAIVDKVNQGSMEGWREAANLANTLSHELVHRKQDKWAWRGSFWSETFGRGNACEQEAWGHSFEKWQAWLARTNQELRDKSNASTRERAAIAQKLKLLTEACEVQVNDLKTNGGAIGKPRMSGSDGVPMSVDELTRLLATYKKIAKTVIGVSEGYGTNFNGIYQGQLTAPDTEGTIGLKIDGYTVSGRFRGKHQGDTFEGELQGKMDGDGNLNIKIWGGMAIVMWKLPGTGMQTEQPVEQSIAGEFPGAVGKDGRASGSFSINTGKYRLPGTWTAQRTK